MVAGVRLAGDSRTPAPNVRGRTAWVVVIEFHPLPRFCHRDDAFNHLSKYPLELAQSTAKVKPDVPHLFPESRKPWHTRSHGDNQASQPEPIQPQRIFPADRMSLPPGCSCRSQRHHREGGAGRPESAPPGRTHQPLALRRMWEAPAKGRAGARSPLERPRSQERSARLIAPQTRPAAAIPVHRRQCPNPSTPRLPPSAPRSGQAFANEHVTNRTIAPQD